MPHIAFKMHLFPGQTGEYKNRHDELWPELSLLLKSIGISEYAIFLDEETNTLFSTLHIEDPAALDDLPNHPIMQRWWTYMSDIMATNSDKSPVSIPLKEVFHLP